MMTTWMTHCVRSFTLPLLLVACADPQATWVDQVHEIERPAQRLTADENTLSGPEQTDIDRAIRRRFGAIRYCYQKHLATQPDLAGELTIRFIIDPDGTVAQADTHSTTLNHPGVEACIAEQIRQLDFPAPHQGEAVTVDYPFTFSTDE